MPKRYWWILVVYIACQLSGLIPHFIPLLDGIPKAQRAGVWIVGSFCVTLVIIILLLLPERKMKIRTQASIGTSITWAILGLIMLFIAQTIAALIEQMLFGESRQSQNTTQIINLAKVSPYVVLVVSIVGPILEEIIFRKIIFGSIYKKTNFIIGALVSSLLFALAHMDNHILVYTFVGFTLAYLYKKTGRIVVSMFAHAGMNTVVVLLALSPHIQKIIQEQATQFIGGFFH